ncbi:MAG: cyclase family protein [Gammaproteobacteria bacterium]
MSTAWTSQRMQALFDSVKNWGRWGSEDQAGALNFITAAKRLEAARCVIAGESVSCARDLAVQPAPDNPHPALHMIVQGGDDCVSPGSDLEATMDFVGVAFHGMSTSHIDALCHIFVDGRMYNGFPGLEVRSTGARFGSIMCARDGIVSRGVLLDLPRVLGRRWLEPGEAIMIEQLEAAERAQGVTAGTGDILLVATGRDARRAEHGPWSVGELGLAGLHAECAAWLHRREIAVLGCDGVSDCFPGLGIPGWSAPIHQCAIAGMGIHLLDNLRLDALADACARHGRWSFQLTVAPLRVDRGTGSPINPIALL